MPLYFILSRMENNCFEIGNFPDIFEVAHVTALWKRAGLKCDPVSVLGREEGCTVKYTPSPEGVPKGKGVFLTVYPESNPIMDSISFK